MKVTILRAEQEFVEKYSEFIYREINEHYDAIRESVKFLTRVKTNYDSMHSVTVTLYLPWFQEENRKESFFSLEMDLTEKLTFWLHFNDEEPMILDIEGFSCRNSQDEELMYERRENAMKHNGPDLLYP